MGSPPPRRTVPYRNDPDETEGRRLYRNEANALATRQLAYEKRRVRLKKETDNAG